MYKRANEQKTFIQNCSLSHPFTFSPVVSYMIHACFEATGEPTTQYLYIIWMDPVDKKKKTVKYFFDTAPACRTERVKHNIVNDRRW